MNLTFPRGDQFAIEIPIVDDNNIVITVDELDEVVVTCREEPNKDSPVLFEKKLSKGDIIYNESTGLYETWIMREDTAELDYSTYGYDVEVTMGKSITTKEGSITLTNEYTIGE